MPDSHGLFTSFLIKLSVYPRNSACKTNSLQFTLPFNLRNMPWVRLNRRCWVLYLNRLSVSANSLVGTFNLAFYKDHPVIFRNSLYDPPVNPMTFCIHKIFKRKGDKSVSQFKEIGIKSTEVQSIAFWDTVLLEILTKVRPQVTDVLSPRKVYILSCATETRGFHQLCK